MFLIIKYIPAKVMSNIYRIIGVFLLGYYCSLSVLIIIYVCMHVVCH